MAKEKRLQINDYVEGYELYGNKEIYIRGTITNINYNEEGRIIYCMIQCDDAWNGARANGLITNRPIKKIEEEPFWWKLCNRFEIDKEELL